MLINKYVVVVQPPANSRPNVGYNLTNELLCLAFALQQIRKRNYREGNARKII